MIVAWAALAAASAGAETLAELEQQVRQAETGFARSLANRDTAAFASYLAEDAVFFGKDSVQRGKAAVVASWKPLFEGPKAPFSWESRDVEVLSSGTLAHSSGPVKDPTGRQFGTFNSVWRREKDGSWKVVMDKGCDVCNCGPASPPSTR
jgi:ketosteroid isomerase-like protein